MSKEDDNFASIPVSKPSIFEIVAHEAVAAVFRPAFHYVVRILAQKYPEKLGFALKCADEIYMLCDLVLQRHYLSYYNASLSENFYYLKRVDMLSGKARPLSTKSLQNLSLMTLVVLPYLKAKMDKVFEDTRDRTIRQEDSGSTEQRKLLTRVFLKIYPFVHFALESASAFYKFGYVLDLLEYHGPLFQALKIQLVRASSEDLLGVQPNVFPNSGSFLQMMVSLPSFLMDKIVKSIAFIMPAVIFSLQFVEWWYSTEHEITSSATRLPIPPPPESPKVSEIGCDLPAHPLQCPLCQNVHRNMAALVSTGFVFCYPCIHQYLTQHGVCPVTQIPSSLDQILRIYSLKDT